MNYFNYFTEIEDHFRRARGTGMFMFSPLDWALIEAWKDAGVPLEAVLKGIDRAFEKHRGRRTKRHMSVNSVAYCTQEVIGAARETADMSGIPDQAPRAGFEPERLAQRFRACAADLRRAAAEASAGSEVFSQIAASLEEMAEQAEAGELGNLEATEQRLSALEDRMLAAAALAWTEEQSLAARQDLERQLKAYRRKMNAEQIAMLERRFLQRKSLEDLGLSRLSLFHAS